MNLNQSKKSDHSLMSHVGSRDKLKYVLKISKIQRTFTLKYLRRFR